MTKRNSTSSTTFIFPTKEEYFITVDPSIRSMGVVVWRCGDARPLAVDLLAHKKGDWVDAGEAMHHDLLELFGLWGRAKKIYCESPKFHSMVTAASGALVKLSWGCGVVAACAWQSGKSFHPVEVNRWKGQLPKSVVNARIKGEIQNCSSFRQDIWDAVGIGLYLQGRF